MLNIFKSSKFACADWSRICSISVSSGCVPGAVPTWWPVLGLAWTELVEGPTLPPSPPMLLYCHMPDDKRNNYFKNLLIIYIFMYPVSCSRIVTSTNGVVAPEMSPNIPVQALHFSTFHLLPAHFLSSVCIHYTDPFHWLSLPDTPSLNHSYFIHSLHQAILIHCHHV